MQRIRTAAGIPVDAAIIDRADVPIYVRIADKAKQFRELGMTDREIARALRVTDKTVAKAACAAEALVPGVPRPEDRSHD
ncbi:MAG TPA: hypothetical protein VEF89_14575 [Solirubrobacteraceae bacterium]|nr:hypothetical protein [Solirubrobacteraceae bacterium]